jgi:MFS family permease
MHPREFVAFIASLMAVNALGVDLMLPALANIGHDLAVTAANHRQWVVTVYMVGFGAGQLVYGPLADRFGRRPILIGTLIGFVAASVFAASSATFGALLFARLLQGLMSASTRVLAIAIVRDGASGRQMARTMSVAQMIFFLVPILAPTLGQGLLTFGPWRFIFYALGMFAAIVLAWVLVRVPETLPPARRVAISMTNLRSSYRLTLTNRYSIGYAIAASLTFGAIIAFVSSAQQIFVDEFGAGERFTLLFAICAGAMGVASFMNSRLVERLGTRLISQSAVPGDLYDPAGPEHDMHRLVRVELRFDGDGARGAYRRYRLVGAGFHRQHRCGDRRFRDRPVLRRHHRAPGDRLLVHRSGGSRDRLCDRAGPAVLPAHEGCSGRRTVSPRSAGETTVSDQRLAHRSRQRHGSAGCSICVGTHEAGKALLRTTLGDMTCLTRSRTNRRHRCPRSNKACRAPPPI